MKNTARSNDDPREGRYLVIGATGLLGRHIVRELAGRQWPVSAMRRWDESTEGIEFPGVDVVVADIFEPSTLEQAVAGINGVFYCAPPKPSAGADPRRIMSHYVEGIRRVLTACRDHDVDRVIVTSSASTVARGAPGWRATEADYYLPGSSEDPFAEANYAAEVECYRHIVDGLDVVIVNPTLLVGPGVDLGAYARLGVEEGQPVNVIDVREAARVHAEAYLRGTRGARYLLGGTNTTAEQVFEGWSRRGRNQQRPSDAYLVECGQWIDSALARKELGLKAEE